MVGQHIERPGVGFQRLLCGIVLAAEKDKYKSVQEKWGQGSAH
jgi:hypothetical protein